MDNDAVTADLGGRLRSGADLAVPAAVRVAVDAPAAATNGRSRPAQPSERQLQRGLQRVGCESEKVRTSRKVDLNVQTS